MNAVKRIVFLSLIGLLLALSVQTGLKGQEALQGVRPVHDLLLQCSVIDELDSCVQARFITGNMQFGLERVGASSNHLRVFRPENQAEREAVAGLDEANLQVIFFLTGRGILTKVTAAQWAQLSSKLQRRILSSPVSISSKYDGHNLNGFELFGKIKQATEALLQQSQFEFSEGDWKFIARPLHAREECLKCHLTSAEASTNLANKPKLKVGDLLGAKIYALRQIKTHN
jgi:hypothetical protein